MDSFLLVSAREAIKNKALADTARKMVETKAPPEIPVREFNAELQKQYQAADYLHEPNDKKVPIGNLQKARQMAGRIGGVTIAHSFGGGMLGGVGGYHLGGILESMIEYMPNPVKNHFLNNLETTNPEAFKKVQADESFYLTASRALDAAQRAAEIFDRSEPMEKRAILGFMLQNPTLSDKKTDFMLRKPFDTIALVASQPAGLRLLDDVRTLLLQRKPSFAYDFAV